MKAGKVMQYVLPFVIGGSVLAAGFAYNQSVVSPLQSTIAEHATEIHDLKNELDTALSEASAAQTKVKKNLTGIDQGQVEKDNQKAREFFTPAFTWSDGKTYDAVRAEYQKVLPQESTFLTQFLPENVKVDQYNYIDQYSVNAKFEEMTSYVTDVAADGYTYIGFITFSSNWASYDGKTEAIVEYKVTTDGNVKDVSAWAPSMDTD